MQNNYMPPPTPEKVKQIGIPANKIWYYRFSYTGYLIVLGLIFRIISQNRDSPNSDLFLDTILSALGAAFGLGFIPMIIAVVRFFMKKKPAHNIYNIFCNKWCCCFPSFRKLNEIK